MARRETPRATDRETTRDADLRSNVCGECGAEPPDTGTGYSLVSQTWRLARSRDDAGARPSCPACGEGTTGTPGA